MVHNDLGNGVDNGAFIEILKLGALEFSKNLGSITYSCFGFIPCKIYNQRWVRCGWYTVLDLSKNFVLEEILRPWTTVFNANMRRKAMII
jgi:hypothetical protein